MSNKLKAWETTKEPNLLRNVQSGLYYARFKVSGKSKWTKLETDDFQVAVSRISEERLKVVRGRRAHENVTAGTATMGELAGILRDRINGNGELGEKTKARYTQHIDAVFATWPGFAA